MVNESRELLQKTATEQDVLDGGEGKTVYVLTDVDVVISEMDWGVSGAISNNNVRQIIGNTDNSANDAK